MVWTYQARSLTYSYPLGETTVTALSNLSFDLPSGAFVALSGPSGSGKSTLLNLMGMIEPLQQGTLTILGQDLSQASEITKNNLRRHKIGFIFQSFHLMNVLTCLENVEYFLHKQNLSALERRQRVESALKSVGLWEHRNKIPTKLSGGQRQRVAIARAIAKKPDIILADEPTASLDQKTGQGIMENLKDLNKNGVTVVVCSHDPMVLKFAPQLWKLTDGQLQTTH